MQAVRQGRAHSAGQRRVHSLRRRLGDGDLTHSHDRLTRHDQTVQRQQADLALIGQQDGRDQALGARRNHIEVQGQQRVAGLHPIPGGDMSGKARAVQAYRLQPQVDQDFGPLVGANADGVAGAGQDRHHSVKRRAHRDAGRVDGQAVADQACGEGLIRDFVQGADPAVDRGVNDQFRRHQSSPRRAAGSETRTQSTPHMGSSSFCVNFRQRSC
ncbi:hypothetical protein D3C80_1049740 [compost metagenome]